jgi:hypothetical protein
LNQNWNLFEKEINQQNRKRFENFLVVVSKTKRMRKEVYVCESDIFQPIKEHKRRDLSRLSNSTFSETTQMFALKLLYSFSSIISFDFV